MSIVKNGIKEKTQPSALDRLEALEGAIPQIIGSVNNALNNIQNQMSVHSELQSALLDVLGEKLGVDNLVQLIQDKVREAREARVEEQVIQQKTELDTKLLNGELKAVETITDNSIVVGREYSADGAPMKPSRVQFYTAALPPELREAINGHVVLERVPLPQGSTFEVLEVYETVPSLPSEQPAPQGTEETAIPAIATESPTVA